MASKKEFAPGIPDKDKKHELPTINKPKVWEYAVQEHLADVRGKHLDVRLGDPDRGHAHSFALADKWPKPGESMWAVQQPTHTVKYMDFEGEIPEGYGKGTVKLKDRGKIEITNSEPGHVSFNVYRGTGPEEYTLHRVHGDMWKFYNRTTTREGLNLPTGKPAYKEVKKLEDKHFENPDELMSAKIDDAHNLFYFPSAGKKVRVVSYRPSKRSTTGIIEHTHKVKGIGGTLRTPAGLHDTLLRGGLFAFHPKTKKATDSELIGGMLNSDVWKSREKQKEHGSLTPVLYDVERFRGKDMKGAPYDEKMEVIKKVMKAFPKVFSLPPHASTPEEKKKLIEAIGSGEHPHTQEGVVIWNKKEGIPPTKFKFKKEHDVYIREFTKGEGKYKGNGVGGFRYSHTPDGPIVGSVGTGLSDVQRRDMHKNPENYVGMVAKIKSMKMTGSQALFQPAFDGFHLDKNEQSDLDQVKLASEEAMSFWEGFDKEAARAKPVLRLLVPGYAKKELEHEVGKHIRRRAEVAKKSINPMAKSDFVLNPLHHLKKVAHDLSSGERNNLPSGDFVFPKDRRYPIEDENHARNALARASQHGTPKEKKEVESAVHQKYPDIEEKTAFWQGFEKEAAGS